MSRAAPLASFPQRSLAELGAAIDEKTCAVNHLAEELIAGAQVSSVHRQEQLRALEQGRNELIGLLRERIAAIEERLAGLTGSALASTSSAEDRQATDLQVQLHRDQLQLRPLLAWRTRADIGAINAERRTAD